MDCLNFSLIRPSFYTFFHHLIIFANFYSSTCVDESRVCQGVPLCPNKSDLKWCKNASSWSQPDAEWKPLHDSFLCSLSHLPNMTKHNGQWIEDEEAGDGRVYNCLNRMDETPFVQRRTKNASKNASKKTWQEWVNEPCDYISKRRCLGTRPDQCVDAISKF